MMSAHLPVRTPNPTADKSTEYPISDANLALVSERKITYAFVELDM